MTENAKAAAYRILLLVVLSIACWIPTGEGMAQGLPGNISVFADPAGSSCSIMDNAPAAFTLYVIHSNMNGTYVSHLKVVESSGFGATYLSETLNFPHIGDFRSGVSFAYGGCSGGTLLLGTITYDGHGTSQECSSVDTAGNPRLPVEPTEYPAVEDCNLELLSAPSLGSLLVNPNPTCLRPCTVSIRTTTWGGIKALYR